MFKKLNLYKHLMSGVSFMLPFVVSGGIFISISFAFQQMPSMADSAITAWIGNLGNAAFSFMLPMLGGYIAYSIANRPGLLPGFIVGSISSTGGSGFIGAVIGGILVGFIMKWLKNVCKKLPASLEGTKAIMIFPLLGVVIAGLLMIVINSVVGPINVAMNNFLQNLSGANMVLLGLIVGGMMAVDMGGPVNKTAYLFAVASLTAVDGSNQATQVMACVGAAGMVIASSCGLATILFPKKFNKELRDAGKAACILGLTFIAEGAIPFAAAKPKVILPSIIVGSAVTGALVGAFGITLGAPAGGLFTLPLVSNIGLYLLAYVVGTLVATGLMWVLTRKQPDEE